MSATDFATLPLTSEQLDTLKTLNYEQMAPVQAQRLPAMLAGQELELPISDELAVYVVSGSLLARHTQMNAQSMVVFNTLNGAVTVKALEATQIAILGGQGLGPHHIEWNFVSTDPAKIEQAKRDWKAERFAKVPGDDSEFIPLPE